MPENPELDDILKALGDTHPSVRLQAVDRLLQALPFGPDLEKILAERLQVERDEECLNLLRHAFDAVKQALEKPSYLRTTSPERETPVDFPSLPLPERLHFLRSLRRESLRFFADQAPEWFLQEKNPIIAAALVKVFGKTWPSDRLQELATNLLSYPGSVRMAVLDLLIEKRPDALVRYLPKLLATRDPKLHLMAIRGLFKIDVPEALKYLEFFLSHEQRPEREMAILDLFHIPFSDIKPALFAFFTVETDLRLLEKAGALFESNPDIEVPYRLAEIAENSSQEKAELIKGIIKNSFQVLWQSGLVKNTFDNYLSRFQTWNRKRQARRFFQQLLARLQSLPEEDWPELEPRLDQALKKPEIAEALPSVLTWDLTPAMKAFLERRSTAAPESAPSPATGETFAEPAAPATVLSVEAVLAEKPVIVEPAPITPPVQAIPATLAEFQKLPEQEQKKFFSRYVEIDSQHRLKLARQIVQRPDISRKIKAAALRCCGNMKFRGLEELAESWLKSGDDELQVGALNYIAETNPEDLFLHLRKCLHSTRPRVKVEAVRLLQKIDTKEALEFVKTMLDPRSRGLHETGLAASACFDFSLIRDPLYKMLQEDVPLSTFETGLSLFRANPGQESLYLIFKLKGQISPERAGAVLAAETRMMQDLVSLGVLDEGKTAEWKRMMESRWEEECATRRKPEKPYAFQTLKPAAPSAKPDSMHLSMEKIRQALAGLKPWVLAVPLALIGIIGMVVWFSRAPETVSAPEPPANPAPVRFTAIPEGITGTIGFFPPGHPPSVRFLTSQNQDFLVIDIDERLKKARPGQQFELQVKPLKIGEDGITVVRFVRILRDFGATLPRQKP